jgi:iron complex transport system permease protein
MTTSARRLMGLLVTMLLIVTIASLLIGRSGWQLPIGVGADGDLARLILWELRVPRTLLVLLTGAVLGLAGAALQGFTRNPLAEPGLLGVSSGAALGAVIGIYTGLGAIWALAVPVLGFLGALLAAALTLALGTGGGLLTLILAGAAISSLFFAGTALALNLAPNPYAAFEITQWMLGSVADRGWHLLLLALPFVLIGLFLLMRTGRALDALTLGERQATSLGVDLRRIKMTLLFGSALAVGAITSVVGAIGFIGLIAPHLVRPAFGHMPSRLLMPAGLCGAVLLTAADVLTRLLPMHQELKLGVLTALVGAPFFLRLVMRMRESAS